jgi:hypothetical protein
LHLTTHSPRTPAHSKLGSNDTNVKGTMKYATILIVFFLTSCNELSTIDKKLVGKRVWSEKNSDSELSGFINLLPDHSYSYELNWKARVEKLVETFPEPSTLAK